jgi:hypothetical protein
MQTTPPPRESQTLLRKSRVAVTSCKQRRVVVTLCDANRQPTRNSIRDRHWKKRRGDMLTSTSL